MLKYWLAILLVLNAVVLAWQWDAFARWGHGPNQGREPERLQQQVLPDALKFVVMPPASSTAEPAAVEASGQAIVRRRAQRAVRRALADLTDREREVMALVNAQQPPAPGRLAQFGWPVTRAQALAALEDFITHRLADFGRYQDAMWGGQPWLYHAMISSSLNLKLLDPREVIAAAEGAWRAGKVPLASAEGFIRQILGWREYVRGVYWLRMPGYLDLNALDAHEALPDFYWTGDTGMRCLADAIGQTLEHGYAHHIQRLMVTGLYALLLGVAPREVHAWYLAVYVDAVEWVELPNTLGMSQHADAGPPQGPTPPPGPMASKPYIATGQYIARMSDHCRGCRFDPAQRTGERACPFTTLYWDFLARHQARLARNPRMALQVKNLQRVTPEEMAQIRERAQALRQGQVKGC